MQVNRLASHLVDRGRQPGDRLARSSPNCWQYGALDLAAARVGAVLVPINSMLAAGEVAYILRDAEVGGRSSRTGCTRCCRTR